MLLGNATWWGRKGSRAANWESSTQKLLRGDKSLEAQHVIKSCGHQQWPMGMEVSVTESRGRCLAFLFGGLPRAPGFVYVSVPPTPVKCPLSAQGTHIELGKVSLVFLEMSRHGYLEVMCEENYLGLQSENQTFGQFRAPWINRQHHTVIVILVELYTDAQNILNITPFLSTKSI